MRFIRLLKKKRQEQISFSVTSTSEEINEENLGDDQDIADFMKFDQATKEAMLKANEEGK